MAAKGPKPARSIRSLASLVGKAESTVRKWMARDDWLFSRTGPWNDATVGKIRTWAEIQLKPDPAASYHKRLKAVEKGTGEFSKLGEEARTRAEANMERSMLARIRRQILEGRLHDVEACRARRLQQIHAVKGALLSMPRAAAASLEGQSRREIERLLTERVQAICLQFSAGMPGTPANGQGSGQGAGQ